MSALNTFIFLGNSTVSHQTNPTVHADQYRKLCDLTDMDNLLVVSTARHSQSNTHSLISTHSVHSPHQSSCYQLCCCSTVDKRLSSIPYRLVELADDPQLLSQNAYMTPTNCRYHPRETHISPARFLFPWR